MIDPFNIAVAIISIVSAGASYMQAKKAQKKAKELTEGVEANIESNSKEIPVVYGERRVGGVRVYIDTSRDRKHKYLYMVLAMAEGEVESITDIRIDDSPITNGKFITSGNDQNLWYEVFTGTDTQTVSTLIKNGVKYDTEEDHWDDPFQADHDVDIGIPTLTYPWSDNHRLQGVAYLALKFKWDENAYTGIPDVTALVKGKKVYDPRTQTTAWSDNPALCIRDYLTNTRYGKGLPASAIDDTAFSQSANDCDNFTITPFTGAGTTQKLFTMDHVVDTSRTILENLNDMLIGCRAFMPYSQGKYGLKIDQTSSSVLSVGADQIISGITIAGAKKEDRFNQVKVNFFNKGANAKEDQAIYPEVDSTLYQTYLDEDEGEPLVDEVDLFMLDNYYSAREMARLLLERSRQNMTIAFEATSELINLEVGDVFSLTHPTPAWTNKLFQAQEITLNFDGTVQVNAIEYDADLYTYDTPEEEQKFIGTRLPDPTEVDPVTDLTVSTGTYIEADGKTIGFLDCSWTAPDDALVDRYEIKFEYNSKTDIIDIANTEYRFKPTQDNIAYTVSVRSVNGLGIRSSWLSASAVTSTVDTTAPAEPTLPDTDVLVGGNRQIALDWINPNDDDFDVVQIQVSTTSTRPADTEILATVKTSYYIHEVNEHNATRYYWIRALDRTGNASDWVALGNATTATKLGSNDLDSSVDDRIDQRIDAYGLGSAGDFDSQVAKFSKFGANPFTLDAVISDFDHGNQDVTITITGSKTWSLYTTTDPRPNNEANNNFTLTLYRKKSADTTWTQVTQWTRDGASGIVGGNYVLGSTNTYHNGISVDLSYTDDSSNLDNNVDYDYKLEPSNIGSNYRFDVVLTVEVNEIGTNNLADNYVDSFSINDTTGLITLGRTNGLSDLTDSIAPYVSSQVSNLVDSAPDTLNTLNELASALGDDANFSVTVTNSIGTKWTQDNTKISNWDTAYGWGDHSTEGYLTSLGWNSNDNFTGTYPIVWKASDTPYTASWLKVNGTTDTLHSVNFNASGAFIGRLQGASTGAPDSTIWCVSGQYTDWGIFYDEDTPDKIQFKSAGNTKASIALDNGNIETVGSIKIDRSDNGAVNSLILEDNARRIYLGRDELQCKDLNDSNATLYINYDGGAVKINGNNNAFHDSYHPNADKWTTARTLSLTGDVTGSVSWDGSSNASITTTVVNDSHNHDHSDGRFTVGEELRMSASGNIRSDSEFQFLTIAGNAQTMQTGGIGVGASYSTYPAFTGGVNVQNGYRVAGQTVIDSSRNLTNIGDATLSSGKLEVQYYSSGTDISSAQINFITDAKTGWGAGDEFGRIRFYCQDGSGIGARDAVEIKAVNNAGNGTSTTTFEGELEFYTSAYNAQKQLAMRLGGNGKVDIFNSLTMNGTTVIDSSRNLLNIGGTYKANLGRASFSWNGSTNYPTLYGSHADRWVMMTFPHIPYLNNGQRGFTGTTVGSVTRYEGWGGQHYDSGILSRIGDGRFSISRHDLSSPLLTGYSANSNQHAVTIGSTLSTWDTANRTTLQLNGNSTALLGFANNGAPKGYIYSTGSDLEFLAFGEARLLSNASGSYYGKLNTGVWNVSHGYQLAGTTVIDSSRTHFSGTKGYNTTATGTTSTTASTGIKQTYAEGWTAIFADYEPYHEWGLYHDNPQNRFIVTGGNSTNNIGSFSVTNHSGATRTAYEKIILNQADGTVSSGGGYKVGTTTVIDSSRNLTNIGTASIFRSLEVRSDNQAGYVQSGLYLETLSDYRGAGVFMDNSATNEVWYAGTPYTDHNGYYMIGYASGAGTDAQAQLSYYKLRVDSSGNVSAKNSLQVNGTTVIDSSRNLTNIGNITALGGSLICTKPVSATAVINGHDQYHGMQLRGEPTSASAHTAGDVMSFYEYGGIFKFFKRIPTGLTLQVTFNNGSIIATGNVTAYSDVTLKDNITEIDNALEKVNSIRGVTYDRIDQDNARHAGVIAQEVEEVLPEVVHTDDEGIKSVAYGNMVGLLIEAIKELKSEIEELKNGNN